MVTTSDGNLLKFRELLELKLFREQSFSCKGIFIGFAEFERWFYEILRLFFESRLVLIHEAVFETNGKLPLFLGQ